MTPMRVTIAYQQLDADAPLDEQDVLVQVAAVRAALERLGHTCALLPVSGDLRSSGDRLQAQSPDVVFNLVETIDGCSERQHLAPALFARLGIAFTGSDERALAITTDKLRCKRMLRANGVPTPVWLEPRGTGADSPWPPGAFIVKPVREDASVGIDDASVCDDAVQARARLDQLQATRADSDLEGDSNDDGWFAEQFIEGREFNVSVIESEAGRGEPMVLPVAEIRFVDYPPDKPRLVGYAAKWQVDSFEYLHTPRSFEANRTEPELMARLREVAIRCWRCLGLSGYARVDFRVDTAGRVWVLEVNTNPCLSADAGFAAALDAAGHGYDWGIARILAAAECRYPVAAVRLDA